MFNASIIYFVIPFMSQAFFYSPLLSTLSSLLPFFSLYPRPINFPFYLSSFYSFILYRHSITESKEGRENSTCMKKKNRIFVTNIYRFFNLNETKTYFESQARLLFLRHTRHKKACLRRDFDLQFPNESVSFVTMKICVNDWWWLCTLIYKLCCVYDSCQNGKKYNFSTKHLRTSSFSPICFPLYFVASSISIFFPFVRNVWLIF